MRAVLLWFLAGSLFTGAWSLAHYARFNDTAELVTMGAICLLTALFDEDA
jgi:hypothetical protein